MMSDYLGNLAARSLEMAEVIQPRPRPLFEPPSPDGWLPPAPGGGLNNETVEGALPNLPLLRQAQAAPPPVPNMDAAGDAGSGRRQEGPAILDQLFGEPEVQRAPSPAPVEILPAGAASRPVEAAPVPQPGRPPLERGQGRLAPRPEPLQAPEGERAAGQGVSQAREAFAPPPLASPRLHPAGAVAAQAVRPRTGPEPVSPPATDAAEGTPRPMARTGETSTGAEADALAAQQIAIERLLTILPAPQSGAERARTDGRPEAGPREGHGTAEIKGASQHQPAPPATVPTPALVVARPQVTHAPRAEPAAPQATKEALAPEVAPTIQVTIGRVEVRATPPAPALKRPRAKPPAMSLDEYLRQRNQGGQR